MPSFCQQQQQATSPLWGGGAASLPGAGGSGSVDWAFLLRSAGMLPRDGSTSDMQQYHQQQQHYQHLLGGGTSSSSNVVAASPQQQREGSGAARGSSLSPRGTGSQLQGGGRRGGGSVHMFSTSSSSSGLTLVPNTNSSLMPLDALGGASFSADALAGGGGHPSNSSFGALLSASNSLAPNSVLAGMMYGGDGVQTLYASDDAAAAAAAAAAAMSATARAHHSAAQSILQQQQHAATALSGLNLASSLSLSGLGKYEESLSGSLFGTGPMPPALLSPKPMSASLYIKVGWVCVVWRWQQCARSNAYPGSVPQQRLSLAALFAPHSCSTTPTIPAHRTCPLMPTS
jgi:hypothetical protein